MATLSKKPSGKPKARRMFDIRSLLIKKKKPDVAEKNSAHSTEMMPSSPSTPSESATQAPRPQRTLSIDKAEQKKSLQMFVQVYSSTFNDEIVRLRRMFSDRERGESILGKVGNFVDVVGMVDPSGVGAAFCVFVAGVIAASDLKSQMRRIRKLFKLAYIDEQKRSHLAHHAAVALAERYAHQIVQLDTPDSFVMLCKVAVLRAFQYLGCHCDEWDVPTVAMLVDGARLGASGRFKGQLTNNNLESHKRKTWVAEGVLAHTAILQNDKVWVDANSNIAKYGVMILKEETPLDRFFEKTTPKEHQLTPTLSLTIKNIQDLLVDVMPLMGRPPTRAMGDSSQQLSDATMDQLGSMLLSFVQNEVMPKLEAKLQDVVDDVEVLKADMTGLKSEMQLLMQHAGPQLNSQQNHNLPARNPLYQTRAKPEAALKERVCERSCTLVFSAPSGFGKSQMVKNFAHAALDKNEYHLVWLIQGRSKTELEHGYRSLAELLGVNLNTPDITLTKIIDRVHQLLCNDERLRDWLLIYDDVKTEADLFAMIPQRLPERHGKFAGHKLITSRSPNWTFPVVPVPPFDDTEALAFLHRVPFPKTISVDDAALSALAKSLGNHPLAIAQAAGYMRKKHASVLHYLEALKQRRQSVSTKELDMAVLDGFNSTLSGVLDMSFDELAVASPLAVLLLDHIAMAAPLPLRCDILEMLVAQLRDSRTAKQEVGKALDLCVEYGLLFVSDENDVPICRMHQLTLELRRADLRLEDQNNILLNWMKVFSDVFSGGPQSIKVRQAQQKNAFSHADTVINEWNKRQAAPIAVITGDAQARNWRQLAALMDSIVVAGVGLADRKKIEDMSEASVNISRAACGENHREVARALRSRGIYYSKGLRCPELYPEAVDFLERSISILRRLQKRDSASNTPEVAFDLAITLDALAWAICELGEDLECGDAIDFATEACDLLHSFPVGEKKAELAQVLNTLGCLYDKQGDFEEALSAHEEARSIRKQLFGERSAEVADSLNNIAIVLQHQKRFQEAGEMHVMALSIAQSVYGHMHTCVALCEENYAQMLLEQDKLEEAETHFEAAHRIYTSLFGHFHRYVFDVLRNLGNCTLYQGNNPNARKKYDAALAVAKHLEPTEMLCALVRDDIASCEYEADELLLQAFDSMDVEDWDGAIAICEDILRQDEEVFGELVSHRHVMRALFFQGLAYMLKGGDSLAKAEAYLQRASAMARECNDLADWQSIEEYLPLVSDAKTPITTALLTATLRP